MKSSNQSICWWAVTLQDVLLTFLMYAGERTSQIILIRWYSGQSHLDINSNAVAIQMTDLDLTWLFPPSLSAKQKLIIADFFFFYHVCCRVVVRLALNLKLIKDTQQHSLLTWLFTFPSPFFSNPFIHPSVLQWSLSLRIQADGTGECCLMPGGQYGREYGKARWREGKSQSVLLRSWHNGAVCFDLW